ncbi:MAG: peptidoglycan DD-metalloendopeptidase family protein [Ardenticatenales bacterium]|nr:peptidoglycan DD-metalloendopeptidase family protein [Ardenticatenales bacterium]
MNPLSPLPISGALAGGEPDPRRRRRRRRRFALAALLLGAVVLPAWWQIARPSFPAGPIRLPAWLAATATPSPSPRPATPSPRPSATATPWAPAVGVVSPPAPFFRFGRPFDPPDLALPANSYLYGTNAEGSLLLHHGNDLGAGAGTEVRSIGDGTVAYAGEDEARRFGPTFDFFGRLVIVRHDATLDGQPLYSLYGHLASTRVRYGQKVQRGAAIGTVGMAGIALGPHLHLEVRTAAVDYEATRNPLLFLAPVPGTGAVVARVRDAVGRPLHGAQVGLFALDGGERWIANSRTYPAEHVHPTAPFDENLVFSDLPPGRYALSMVHHSASIRTEVTIPGDGVAFAVLAP